MTNTASRLTATARDGQIFVDAETYEDVAKAYPDAKRRVLELKGKDGPVEAYSIPP